MADSVTVDGTRLTEGMTLWRLQAVNVFNSFESQDPDAALQETASQLVNRYPDAVDNATVDEVKRNLRDEPGYYDDTDLMQYQAMEVESVRPERGSTPAEISIRDVKERKTFVFTPRSNHPDDSGYMNWEPLSTLENHLNTTLLPVK